MLRLKTELARESIECHRLCKELQVYHTHSLTHSPALALALSLARARSVTRSLSLYINTQ
jgi:hypothetical protein